jgi:uncharacterized protein YndB with AHSA1/START domain
VSGGTEARAVLHLKRTFDAPRSVVYRAWTEPELFSQWFRIPGAAIPVVEMDVREGGSYRISMRQGTIATRLVGEYLDVEPPERLVYTFRWDPPVVEEMETGETRVTVEFRDRGEETEVVLIHEQLRDEVKVRDFHEWGWQTTFDHLAALLPSFGAS